MVLDIDMLHLSVVLGILGECDCPPAVPTNQARNRELYLHLTQPTLHPDHLLCRSRHHHIFSFDGREGDGGLSLTTPGNRSTGHDKDIP